MRASFKLPVLLILFAGMGVTGCHQQTSEKGEEIEESNACFESISPDSEFRKPDCPSPWEKEFLEPGEFEPFNASGAWYYVWGREHMHSALRARESWLFEDEPFVINGYFLTWGMPENYTAVALIEGQTVPLRLFEVGDTSSAPTLEEIQTLEAEDYLDGQQVTIPQNQPFNYSIAVPPSAFPEKGSYNLHILFLPHYSENPDVQYLNQEVHLGGTYTVNYGAYGPIERYGEEPDAVESAWDHKTVSHTAWNVGGFLAPPTGIYDWKSPDVNQVELGNKLETSSESVALNFFGAQRESKADLTGENLYLIREGNQITHGFAWEPDANLENDSFIQGGERASHIPLEVDVSATPMTFQVFAFGYPFERQPADGRTTFDASNALIIEQSDN